VEDGQVRWDPAGHLEWGGVGQMPCRSSLSERGRIFQQQQQPTARLHLLHLLAELGSSKRDRPWFWPMPTLMPVVLGRKVRLLRRYLAYEVVGTR
jgi:hypothetical protein